MRERTKMPTGIKDGDCVCINKFHPSILPFLPAIAVARPKVNLGRERLPAFCLLPKVSQTFDS
jgi:hypothetical protein